MKKSTWFFTGLCIAVSALGAATAGAAESVKIGVLCR